MSTPIVATGAAALGFYVWLRRWQQCGYAGVIDLPAPFETHARTEQPPTTWSETIYLFKEALRYMYQETLGKWHAIDLFFGLAYLSRRPTNEYPAADIATAGQPLHHQHMQPQAAQQLMQQLQEVKRYMLYCQGLKHHKPELQLKHWRITTGLEPEDVIKHSPTAGLLRPAYVIFKDRAADNIILCVRGTHSRSDMFTSLTGTVKPHHSVTADGVALGYSHLGMLAAARWLLDETRSTLVQALQANPGHQLRVVGHSMGGGTAAMLTMMMRDKVPELSQATAWAIACPACMTLDLAASCAPFVTTLVHGTDLVPTFSSGAIDRLRDEVTQSSWFAEFQGDVQKRLAANFSASVRVLRLHTAGEWTHRNIISTAATSFRSCYSRGPQSCYQKRSDWSPAGAQSQHDSPPVTPHKAAEQHKTSWGFSALSSRQLTSQKQQQLSTTFALQHVHNAADAATTTETSALLLQSVPQPTGPLHWLRTSNKKGRRPGFAAAAASPGVSRTSSNVTVDDVARHTSAAHAEAQLVEHALQACLMAADAGQLAGLEQDPPPSSAAAADTTAPPLWAQPGLSSAAQAAVFSAHGNTAASRGTAALATGWATAASRVGLRTKRPTAPGKKDDDDDGDDEFLTLQPPLQQSRLGALQPLVSSDMAAAAFQASTATGLAGGANRQQAPVSSAAPSAGTAAHAAATSSANKPHPTSLRSRKGWAWGSMLGPGPGDRGWVSSGEPTSPRSLAGGRRVVQYLGQTVGQTGKLMAETTGHLLKSGNVLFQACAVPVPGRPAASAAAVATSARHREAVNGRVARGAPQHQAAAALGASAEAEAPRGGVVVAPSSTEMDRGEDIEGPFEAVLAASLLESDSDSDDSDPDLQEDVGSAPFSLLDQPGLRGNISALVAAVSADASALGQGAGRVQQEEDKAAERLLQGLTSSTSETHMQHLQHHHDPQHALNYVYEPDGISSGMGKGKALRTLKKRQQQQQELVSPAASGRQMPVCGTAQVTSTRLGATSTADSSAEAESVESVEGSCATRDKAAERLARRLMYPAGRVLHLMPQSACIPVQPEVGAGEPWAPQEDSSRCTRRVFPPLTAAQGSPGLGDDYVLLEVPHVEVYGRVKLCPAMVRDHFIPSYLRALDSVLVQLQQASAKPVLTNL